MSDYCTTAQVKAQHPDVISGSSYDTLLDGLVTTASRMIDRWLGHEDNAFVAQDSATDKYYTGSGGYVQRIDPCTSITTVSVKATRTAASYTDWDSGDWNSAAGASDNPDWNAGYYTVLMTAEGISKTFTEGQKTVKVTAKWGRTATCPEVIKEAAIEQTMILFKQAQQAQQRSGGNDGLGTVFYSRGLDRNIKDILTASGYRRLP
jgi:hypothetical protein